MVALHLILYQVFAFHRLCKEIKSNDYRVVLSGVGGDELFAGNYIDHLTI